MKRIFESKTEPLAPAIVFYKRMTFTILVGAISIVLALYVGMLGYHLCEKLSWPDAFLNASMILSGMGPVNTLNTVAGKIFAGCYALFSGLAFVMIVSIIFSPLIHRFFHKMHIEDQDE